jgi:general stress protein YciG
MDMAPQRAPGREVTFALDQSDTVPDTAAMDFKRLSQQAKRLIDKRGGTKSLKEDADELRDIARGGGSMSDKAKAAADAIKEPGAKDPDTPPQSPAQSPPQAP